MATRSLGALTLDLIVKTGGFEKGMDAAARTSEKRLKEIQATASKVGYAIGAAFGISVTGLLAFAKSAVNTADEIGKMSQKIGIATEDLSKLQYAAALADVDAESLGQSIAKLSKATVDPSGDVKAAFDALGVSIADTDGKVKGSIVLIEELADAFSKFEDGPTKTAAAMAIFGKSGAELIPLLNGGSKAIREAGDELERFGGVVTPQAAKAAEDFNDNLTRLQFAAKGVVQEIVNSMLPAVANVQGEFVDGVTNSDAFADSIEGLGNAVKGLVFVFTVLGNTVQGVLRAIVGGWSATFQVLTGEFSAAAETIKNTSAGIMGDVEDVKRSFDTLIAGESLGAPAPNTDKLKEAAKETLKYAGAAEKADKAVKKAAKSQSEWDEVLELHKKIAEEEKERQDAFNDSLEEAGRIFEATRTPLEKFNAELERLNELRNTLGADGKPLIDDVTYRRKIVAMQDDLHGLSETTEEVTDEVTVFWDEAMRNMQDIFADFLVDPFKDGLKGMLQSFEQMLKQMVAQAAAAQIFKAFSAGLTGSGGWLDMLLGLGGGLGVVNGAPPIGKRAMGGPVQPGRTYLVGENGPELFSPNGTGTIIPNGGGMTQNINISIAAPAGTVDRRTMQNTAAEVARAARNASMRNG